MRCALATDLDGTLLRQDLSVSAETRAGLAAAQNRGIGVAFVTGRPARWMKPVIETTGHTGVAVCANGAVTVDLTTEEISSVRTIASDTAAEVRERIRGVLGAGTKFGFEFATPGPISESGLAHEFGFAPRVIRGAAVHDFNSRWEGPQAVKLLARDPEFVRHTGDPREHSSEFHTQVADVLARAKEALHGLVSVTQTSRTDLLLEMGPIGISKASGLRDLARTWNLTSTDFAAVGDMPNDIPMLEWAGRSYAVESAHPAVLQVADIVIPDPDDDGVLALLQTL